MDGLLWLRHGQTCKIRIQVANNSTSLRSAGAFLALVNIAMVSCLASSGSAYPLYPDPAQRRAANEVATLLGDVAIVDDVDVSEHGKFFELLPGCHIVRPPPKWGQTDYNHTIWADLGQASFAIDMKAEHRYVIRVNVSSLSGTGGSLSITAREETMDGTKTRTFRLIKGIAPPDSCKYVESSGE